MSNSQDGYRYSIALMFISRGECERTLSASLFNST